MNPRSRIHLMIVFLLLASLACGISDITGPASATDDPGALDTAVAQSLVETASIQTAIAMGVANTLNPAQGQHQNQNTTVSPTSDKVMVSVSQATNCRSGPGTIYNWLGSLNPGQAVEIFGKDPSNTSWYIKNPGNPSGYCWIWNTFATVTGDTAAVPVYTPMPTPTPANTAIPTKAPIDFAVTFSDITVCNSKYYVEFSITNTGTLIWQSYHTTTEDTVTSETSTESDNSFVDYGGCSPTLLQRDLSPGEIGKVSSGSLAVNPSGHTMKADINICSQDNLAGTCITKSITFTP